MSTEGLTRNNYIRVNQIEMHFNQRRVKGTREATHNECIEIVSLKLNHGNLFLKRYLY